MGRAAAIFGDPLTSPSHRFACLHRRSTGLRARRAGLAGFLRHLLVVMVLALSAEVGVASESSVRFIGPLADHLLDRSGRLTIDEVAPPDSPHRFLGHDGRRAANYGPSPSPDVALWLRVVIPEIAGNIGEDRVLVIREPRIRGVSLFIPAGSGWREVKWRIGTAEAGSGFPTRYPVFILRSEEVTGRAVYLRVQTPSSLRASLWLHTDLDFVSASGVENLMFGVVFGILAALVMYLAAAALIARDATSAMLSGLVLAYLTYVLGDQGFIGSIIWPGGIVASRVMSFGGTFLIFAMMLFYSRHFLKIASHHPRLAGGVRWLAIAMLGLSGVAVVSVLMNDATLRRFVAPIGIASIGLCLTLVAASIRSEPRRALVFIACWGPMFAGGLIRMLHDVLPAIGANPLAVNVNYLATCLSLLLSGFANAIDLQSREREARRAAEDNALRLRAFAESASDSFWECDRHGRITFASGPTCQAIGLGPGQDLRAILGQDHHLGDTNPVADLDSSLAASAEFRAAISLPVTAGGLDQRLVTFRARPAGEGGGLRGIVSDITAEAAAEERTAQQRKMAAIGQLAGGVAHEINNLLHPIVNLSRRVARGIPEGDHRRRLLEIVAESGTRAAAIVAGLLTSVRPTPRTDSHAPLGRALADAVRSLRSMLPDKVALSFENYGEPGPVVDANETFQVLANLVANAIYATRGGGHIDVRFAGSDANGFALSVEDNGEGMDNETRLRAMEPFFTTKQPGQGTGLGLPIVYGIVHAWNATLDIESQPGVGTRVTVAVPGRTEPRAEPTHVAQHVAQG
jgi:signal transduction histidine kinase